MNQSKDKNESSLPKQTLEKAKIMKEYIESKIIRKILKTF